MLGLAGLLAGIGVDAQLPRLRRCLRLPPAPFLGHLYQRIHAVLAGDDRSEEFAHLTEADRQAILEILRETKPGLPEIFRERAPEITTESPAPASPAKPKLRSGEL